MGLGHPGGVASGGLRGVGGADVVPQAGAGLVIQPQPLSGPWTCSSVMWPQAPGMWATFWREIKMVPGAKLDQPPLFS